MAAGVPWSLISVSKSAVYVSSSWAGGEGGVDIKKYKNNH